MDFDVDRVWIPTHIALISAKDMAGRVVSAAFLLRQLVVKFIFKSREEKLANGAEVLLNQIATQVGQHDDQGE